MYYSRYLLRPLPEPVKGLSELAIDMRWSWNHASDVLWKAIDSELWEATGNPWLILESVGQKRLEALARDRNFLKELEAQLEERKKDLAQATWFSETYGLDRLGTIAYFSMEFGLSEALPLYSGGLGILAGDYLKTASDLGIPLVGIGILYQQGYFRQALDAQGNQLEFFPYNDPAMLPIMPLRDSNGDWLRINVSLPGRDLVLRTWEVQVGRVRLLLLDSNDPLNSPKDRGITGKLYGGDSEIRLQQEIVLGIGGWRLIEAMGLNCQVCHLNEGHAALVVLERALSLMKATGLSFHEALSCTRVGNLFTTHTPVDAAFDRFPAPMFSRYCSHLAEALDISLDELLALGRAKPEDASEPFNMAYLALRGSGAINGVSRLHGEVSRKIFLPLFPRWPKEEVPIGHVTNAVHVPSWDSEDSDALWTGSCGKARWLGTLDTVETDLSKLDHETLWNFRGRSRLKLIEFCRKRVARQRAAVGEKQIAVAKCADLLDPNALTMGFARRFTSYKRPNLLLYDPERLTRILNNPARPVQLIIAGKAHPEDFEGKRMIKQWAEYIRRPEVFGKVLFIEDYDMIIASKMVQGVDLWINTPRRPWEASGTSGMKVLVNGGINFSELDGWWAEAFCQEVGWALGDGKEHDADPSWDAKEAMDLYDTLENDIIPAFYDRDSRGISIPWVNRMRTSMARLTPQFSSNRMLRQYTEEFYIPAADNFRKRIEQGGRIGSEIERWRAEIGRHWNNVHFGHFQLKKSDNTYDFCVQIYLDDLDPEAVDAELFAEPLDGEQEPEHWPMKRSERLAGAINGFLYKASIPKRRPSSDYTPRLVPSHPEALVPLEENHILWMR